LVDDDVRHMDRCLAGVGVWLLFCLSLPVICNTTLISSLPQNLMSCTYHFHKKVYAGLRGLGSLGRGLLISEMKKPLCCKASSYAEVMLRFQL